MKLIYLAIPYSGMVASSYYQATRAMALLLKQGEVNVFSPITMCHAVTDYDLPKNWEFWQQIDYDFLDRVDELYVIVPEEGLDFVRESTGVQAEIQYAVNKGYPIKFIEFKRNPLSKKEELVEWHEEVVEVLELIPPATE